MIQVVHHRGEVLLMVTSGGGTEVRGVNIQVGLIHQQVGLTARTRSDGETGGDERGKVTVNIRMIHRGGEVMAMMGSEEETGGRV